MSGENGLFRHGDMSDLIFFAPTSVCNTFFHIQTAADCLPTILKINWREQPLLFSFLSAIMKPSADRQASDYLARASSLREQHAFRQGPRIVAVETLIPHDIMPGLMLLRL